MPDPSAMAALARSLNPTAKTVCEPRMKASTDTAWTREDGYRAADRRAGGRCECNGIGVPGCGQLAEVHHHIAGRGGPDPHRPSNLLCLTDAHHRSIHAHPRDSYKRGLMRSRLAVEQ